MRLQTNDNVLVTKGKDRGKRGRISRVLPEKGRAVVEGVNVVQRHQKPTGAFRSGGIIEKELSVSIDGGSAIHIPAGEDEDSQDESIMWHPSPEVNRSLVGAMRAGLAMVTTGRSKRGTKTVDTYSLHGFSAAYKAISRACGAP